jgi:hypothetical protein
MVGMTAQAVVSHASCVNDPVVVNLAVSTDIGPAIQTVARAFNNQNHVADGRCVQVQVTEGDSAAVAGQVDGQDVVPGMSPITAWIPDSSLWVDIARNFPMGAQAVQPMGESVARSPLMIVTTRAIARRSGILDGHVGWNLLLPPQYGGPPASKGLSVELPDPTDTSPGLATLVELSRELGDSPAATNAFTKFVYSAQATENFDSAPALEAFALSTLALGRPVVTVASEQAVLAYDRANPRTPLAAVYPSGSSPLLGAQELDYPYVLTTTAPAPLQAATAFGRYLESDYAQSVIRYNGFRSSDGVPDAMPASAGLSGQPLQVASAPTATETSDSLQAWEKLGLGSRILSLIDVSQAMNKPDGNGTQTLLQELTQTTVLGLPLFPDSTEMGLWEVGNSTSAAKPYTQLVSLGLLPADYGLLSRRRQLQEINETLAAGNGTLHLNDAILDAYEYVTSTYQSNYVNAVLVLTAGVDGAGDMSVSALLGKLRALYNPSRPVEVVALMFGDSGDFTPLQQIASATGGQAYQVSNPADVGKIFIEAIAHRMCAEGCAAP